MELTRSTRSHVTAPLTRWLPSSANMEPVARRTPQTHLRSESEPISSAQGMRLVHTLASSSFSFWLIIAAREDARWGGSVSPPSHLRGMFALSWKGEVVHSPPCEQKQLILVLCVIGLQTGQGGGYLLLHVRHTNISLLTWLLSCCYWAYLCLFVETHVWSFFVFPVFIHLKIIYLAFLLHLILVKQL